MLDKILDTLSQKKILILGYGREGRSSLQFIRTYLPDCVPGIADSNPNAFENPIKDELKNCKLFAGINYLDSIPLYDFIIKSPGISLLYIDTGKAIISSQTDLFMMAYASQTIGITGTKGKSTTTSLIFHLLKESLFDCVLAGNIGIPCFEVIPTINYKTWVVFELSANQLQSIQHSPHIAVLLNVFEEHLDHFGTFEKYKEAKYNICKFQHIDDALVCHRDFLPEIRVAHEMLLQFPLGLLSENENKMPIKGAHNRLNIEAALLAVHAAGVDMEQAKLHLHSFRGLPHRLEIIGTYDGVTFINDSIATIPEATIAALDTFDNVDYLLLGGFDRGIEYNALIEYLLDNPVPNLLFTGKAGERMMKLLGKYTIESKIMTYDSMNEAFDIMRKNYKENSICLLSPAAASYDAYKNFEHRGDTFRQLARNFNQ
jgi:UDP-N-acetylmuramoylalanine--D-glutamate ligase